MSSWEQEVGSMEVEIEMTVKIEPDGELEDFVERLESSVDKLIREYDIPTGQIIYLEPDRENTGHPKITTQQNGKKEANTPPCTPEDTDESSTPSSNTKKMVRTGVLNAFDDCPDYKFSVSELCSEVKALYGDRLGVKDVTVREYVYDVLRTLRTEGKVERIAQGEYMRLADFNLSQNLTDARRINRDLIDNPTTEG